MAPLAYNNTGLVFVDYASCGEDHTMQLRYGSDGSIEECLSLADTLFNAMDSSLQLVTIIGARQQAIHTNFSLPVTWTGAATYGSGVGDHYKSAWFADFVGRSSGGRRVRVAMFGLAADFDGTSKDYRYSTTESVDVADAVAALEANPNACVAIDGLVASWHQYANIGQNAYWRNRIR